ncbi:MAG: competence/damage-inducible protein A [Bacteroidales bacterium]
MKSKEITAELITIGDEILIGQIVDTNSAWMAEHLNDMGIWVSRIVSIGDSADEISGALSDASQRAHIVLITGGLGPTRDDITKSVMASWFNTTLVSDAASLQRIELYLQKRGVAMNPLNVKQAEVLQSCTVIPNYCGTAPGMWMDKEGVIFVSMPGVPSEMTSMMESEVLPRLRERFSLPFIRHKKIVTSGIGESDLALLIQEWELALPSHIRLAYLPTAGYVKLRLTAKGDSVLLLENELEQQTEALQHIAGRYILGQEAESPEALLAKRLVDKGLTLSVAESCTGGYLSHRFTALPGASAWYRGGVVAYHNQVKHTILGIPEQRLETYGAVSRETVEAMAVSVREMMGSHYAIAISGVAGPSGGTAVKPVGTVWIAVASAKAVHARHFMLGGDRSRTIVRSALWGIQLLLQLLEEERSSAK